MNVVFNLNLILENLSNVDELIENNGILNKLKLKKDLINFIKKNTNFQNINMLTKYINEFNKVYFIVPNKENPYWKIIVEEFLKNNGLNCTEIIYCNNELYNKVLNTKNIHAIVSKKDKILKKELNNCIETCISDDDELKIALNNILCKQNDLKKRIEDPITVMSDKPSIDKVWNRQYSVAQSMLNIPKMSLFEYLYYSNVNNLDNIAIIYYDKKYTYREFFSSIFSCVKELKEKYQIKPRDVVAICSPNIPEALNIILATNILGAVCLPIHPLSKAEDIKQYLCTTNAKCAMITDTSEKEFLKIADKTNVELVLKADIENMMSLRFKTLYKLQKLKDKLNVSISIIKLKITNSFIPKKYKLITKKINNEIKNLTIKKDIKVSSLMCKPNKKFDLEYEQNLENKISFLLTTGGTTGTSKLAAMTDENFIANIIQLQNTIPSYKSGDVIEGVAPLFHGFGLVNTILAALCSGIAVDLHAKYDKNIFNKSVIKNKPTLILGPPTLYKSMISSQVYKNQNMDYLKVLISGSDRLDPKLRNEINSWGKEHNIGNEIFIGMGLTEGTAAISFTGLNSIDNDSVGFPLPLNNIKIVSLDDGKEVGYNEPGELCLNGPTVMKSYFNNNDETNKVLKIENGKLWLHTGDICEMLPNGEIKFIDRDKGVIVVSGINVYRSRIETVINELREVKECAVIGIAHPYKMNVPKAYIVLKDGYELTNELIEEFQIYCNSKLDKYERVFEFEQIDKLPLTKLNKIDYVQLQELEKVHKKSR